MSADQNISEETQFDNQCPWNKGRLVGRNHNLRAVQLLLGHAELERTVRYLGIEVDDALAIAEQADI